MKVNQINQFVMWYQGFDVIPPALQCQFKEAQEQSLRKYYLLLVL